MTTPAGERALENARVCRQALVAVEHSLSPMPQELPA